MNECFRHCEAHAPNVLTLEKKNFALPGTSPEIAEWNEEFASLVAEYETALTEQDPGWASSTVAEIRKRIEGVILIGVLTVEERLLREVSEAEVV